MTPDQLSLMFYCFLRYYRGKTHSHRRAIELLWALREEIKR